MKARKRVRDEKGIAAIEFALVLPILLILMFGIIEFSILLYDKAMITNASREGARTGILFNSGVNVADDAIAQVVDNYAAANLITFSEGDNPPVTSVSRDDTNGDTVLYNAGDTLTVTVTYVYDFFVLPNLGFLEGFDEILTLTATTVMRFE